MSDSTYKDAAGNAMPVVEPDAPREWRGMSLAELHRARAKALVRREV